MMRKQKRSARRMAVAFLSVIFACSVFGTTAFASQVLTIAEAGDPTSGASEGSSSSSQEPPVTSEEPSESSSEPSSQPSSSEISSSSSEASSSEISSSSSEESSSSSSQSSSESSQSESSSNSSQSDAESSSDPIPSWNPDDDKPSGTITDPHAGVDPTISAPENNDPSALSSQDWSELLSSASGEEASSGASSEESSSSEAGGLVSRNDSSWLLFVGILLIVLGAGGIGGFVYLQFIRPRRVHHNTLEDISQGDTQYMDMGDTGEIPTEFEDISSYSAEAAAGAAGFGSDGAAPEGEGLPGGADGADTDISSVSRSAQETRPVNPYGQAMPVVKKAPKETPHIPSAPEGYEDISSRAEGTRPAVPRLNQEQAQKAAHAPAKPKDGKASDDFDWDQFFNQK